jgi:hypothetical protein
MLQPSNFSHTVILKVLNKTIYGLTNNPNKITFMKVKEMFDKSKLKITSSVDKKTKMYYIDNTSDNYKELTDKVVFKDNKSVIQTKIDYDYPKNTKHISNKEKHTLLKEHYETLTGSSNIFQIFVKLNNITPYNVSNDMLIGHLAYMIHKNTNIPMNYIILTYRSKNLDFTKNIEDYGIRKESNVYVLFRAQGGMFHITSGRNGDYDSIKKILFNLDE